jgi:catechol 2,3-dioxygenase-like lactoylglutathione lyase family enzyme
MAQKPTDWTYVGNIPAKNIERTRRFYEDVLGLEVLGEGPSGIAYRSGSTAFYLYPDDAAGMAEHTLGAFSVSNLEAAMDELRSRGVEFEEYDTPDLKTVKGVGDLGAGGRAAWFKDPEGNILSLAEVG